MVAEMRLSAWPITDVGRVRSHNEDSHFVDDEMGLYLVADGMGGHAGGAHASRTCVEVVSRVVQRGLQGLSDMPREVAAAAVNDLSRNSLVKPGCQLQLVAQQTASSKLFLLGLGLGKQLAMLAQSRVAQTPLAAHQPVTQKQLARLGMIQRC